MGGLVQVLKALGPLRLAMMAGVAAALIGFFGFVGAKLTTPPMALLYADLDLNESGQIVGKLETAKVPYQIIANGSQIMVPQDQVMRLRLQLAESGLPSGGSIGYEIFDRSEALGTTSFVQGINHVRALEGELARTIRSISGVQNARVHLVLPKREVFSREQREPSASIVLKTRGARLEQSQVRAIRNLVAAAVPDLKSGRISIVDDKGTLLADGGGDRDAKTESATGMAELKSLYEERLKRAIEALVERSVGLGNVRAEITADIDFDRVTTNSESFDPEGQVIRSTQSVAEQSQNSDNQANPNVSVQSNLPDANAAPSAQSQGRTSRNEELVNYEISKTIKTQVREAGVVRRISAGVLVNGVQNVDAAGKRTYTARTEEELNQLATLVRSAIGYDEKRGDKVEVLNLRFAEGEELPPAELAGPFELTKTDIMRLIELGVLALVSILGLLFVARPMVTRLLAIGGSGGNGQRQLPSGQSQQAIAGPTGGAGPNIIVADSPQVTIHKPGFDAMIDIARIEGQVKASSMKKIGEIVEKHPEEAVSIVRNWLYQPS